MMKVNRIAVMMKVMVMPGWQTMTVTETSRASDWSQGTVQLPPATRWEHRLSLYCYICKYLIYTFKKSTLRIYKLALTKQTSTTKVLLIFTLTFSPLYHFLYFISFTWTVPMISFLELLSSSQTAIWATMGYRGASLLLTFTHFYPLLLTFTNFSSHRKWIQMSSVQISITVRKWKLRTALQANSHLLLEAAA